ncbi:MAG: DUF2442 domain-containing protein [Saprospiraceae bacterium]|nr:DUF2442 domain-containing protein [Saprospiraceae bacterium]
MFPKPVYVTGSKKYQLHLRFADGVEGTADLSHLVGKGVFRQWESGELFFKVALDPETNAIVWNDTLDVCADNLYLQIKGLPFRQFRAASIVHA